MLKRVEKGKCIKSVMFKVSLFLLLAGVLIQMSCSGANVSRHLIIKDPRSENIFYSLAVEADDTFSLRYRHSVSGSPVEGTFNITEQGKIKPLTTSFTSYGPGLPIDYMELYVIEDGLVTVYHEEEPRDYIRLWVSPQTEEVLYLDEGSYPLSAFSEEHLLIEISIQSTGNR